jgi:hypothetical protein
MISSAWAIVLGVVSGVLTSGLVALGVSYFRNIALPWYRARIYDGVMVAGSWELQSFESTQTGKMELTQQASRLSGSLTLVASPQSTFGNFEELRTFALSGFINDRLVEISFRHTDRSRIGAGVFFLELIGDGRVLRGVQSMYNVANSEVDSVTVCAVRPGARAPLTEAQLDAFMQYEAEQEKKRKAKKKNRKQLPSGARAAIPEAPAISDAATPATSENQSALTPSDTE